MNMKGKKIPKNIKWESWGFIIATGLLILITVLSAAGTVYGRESDRYRLNDTNLKEQEEDCMLQIKEVLEAYGCNNSGITMRKIIDRNGERQYYIMIHHKRINTMDASKKEELVNNLKDIGFSEEGFFVFYEFLP